MTFLYHIVSTDLSYLHSSLSSLYLTKRRKHCVFTHKTKHTILSVSQSLTPHLNVSITFSIPQPSQETHQTNTHYPLVRWMLPDETELRKRAYSGA